MRVPLTFIDSLKTTAPELFRLCERFYEANIGAFPMMNRDRIVHSSWMLATYADTHMLKEHQSQISALLNFYGLKQRRQPLSVPQDGHELLNDVTVAVGNFIHGGEKHFFFTDNLVEKLLATDTAPLTRLPFVSSLLTFTHPAVCELTIKIMKGADALHFVRPTDLKVGVICTKFDVEILMTYFTYNDDFGIHTWGINPLGTIDGNATDDDPERYPANRWAGSWLDDGKAEERQALAAIVLNSLAYLNSTKADLTEIGDPKNTFLQDLATASRTRRQMQRRHAASITNQSTVVAGASVGAIVVQSDQSISRDFASSGRTIQTRFIVRGHWRRQPYGKGLQERKLIFIEPFVKGPDIAEMVNKPYIVKEPKSGADLLPSPLVKRA